MISNEISEDYDNSVDVIILSWDRLNDTLLAIDSSVAQRNVNVNIYVVDQGSKPECVSQLEEHCKQYSNVFLRLNDKNSGVPGGRNIASFMGKGKYIVSLDNDAEFTSEFELEKVVSSFTENPNCAVLAFRINQFGTNDIDMTSWSYGLPADKYAHQCFDTTRFVGAGHAIRRVSFEKVNGYDSSLFFLHEEVDLARRFINIGETIKYLPNISVGHKVSPEHRVSWSEGRWAYHARNKTYLTCKFQTPLHIIIFHTSLLLIDGIKQGALSITVKGIVDGFKLYNANKSSFIKEHITFNEGSENYYRRYTPGASGSVWVRLKRRVKDTFA